MTAVEAWRTTSGSAASWRAAASSRRWSSSRPTMMVTQGVIVSAERIVRTETLAEQPELTKIPGFLVSAVVHAPRGAAPGSCYPLYDYDADAVREYLAVAGDRDALGEYLARCDRQRAIA